MRYWAYINNEVLGPFEKEKLTKLPNFGRSSLICPETPAGEQRPDWKEASAYPEVLAIPTSSPSAPVSPPSPAAESPLAMTMRGSLILDPADSDAAPAAFGAGQPQRSDGSSVSGMPDTVKSKPLAVSSLEPADAVNSGVSEPPKETPEPVLEDSLSSKTPAAVDGAALQTLSPSPGFGGPAGVPDKMPAVSETVLTRQELNSQLEPLRQKLEQMGAMLASIGDGQFKQEMLGRMSRLESAILEIKASLSSEPKK
ncbi:MAG: hypothetical protein KKH28_07615 [Elusimicrobia bacterium]|nr:hypothetical protein [Elusimicrobiota bacterium]